MLVCTKEMSLIVCIIWSFHFCDICEACVSLVVEIVVSVKHFDLLKQIQELHKNGM
jgi:hypothetical protein